MYESLHGRENMLRYYTVIGGKKSCEKPVEK